MKNSEFTKLLAKRLNSTQAVAADQLSRVVDEILQRVRKGKPASLPGLGTFSPAQKANFGFEPRPKKGKKVHR